MQRDVIDKEVENLENTEAVKLDEDSVEATPALVMNDTLVSEEYKGAIRGAIKIMDGMYGGGFFARYIIDTGKMYSWLNLIIVYPDGLTKNLVLFKNYFKETDLESGNGVCTPAPNSKRAYRDRLEGDLANFVNLPQYETPVMPIPAKALWEQIYTNQRRIPYVYLHHTSTTREIHEALKTAASELSQEYENGFMVSSDRFLVEKALFEEIVIEHGRSLCEIRTEFDMMGLFFKDKGKGYQFSKKINGERKRFYAIRNEFLQEPTVQEEVMALEDTTYQGISKTSKTEMELQRLSNKISQLAGKYNDLVFKYNEIAPEYGLDEVAPEV